MFHFSCLSSNDSHDMTLHLVCVINNKLQVNDYFPTNILCQSKSFRRNRHEESGWILFDCYKSGRKFHYYTADETLSAERFFSAAKEAGASAEDETNHRQAASLSSQADKIQAKHIPLHDKVMMQTYEIV